MAAPDGPRSGARLGRHELLLEIGRGGMAQVWIARLQGDLGFSRLVAVKTILPELGDDPGFRRSLFEEARLAAKLRHANVVEVTELGEDGATLYQVMSLVEGAPLGEILQIGRLPPPIAARIASDALAGLHAAHQLTDDDGTALQLVHRDVSPQNIIVGADGVARLTDFGVAKALGSLSDTTQVGHVRGKPGYFAPEQAAGKPVDRRADVFAAGIVLWESLTGLRLFRPMGSQEPLARLSDQVVPSPCEHRPEIPAPIAAVALRALSHDKNARYQTAEEMQGAIEGAIAIATARDVSALIEERFRAALRAQRATLREMTRSEAPRASVPPSASSPPKDAPTPVMSIEEAKAKEPRDIARALLGEAGAGTSMGLPLPRITPQKKRDRRPWVAGAAVLAIGALVYALRHEEPALEPVAPVAETIEASPPPIVDVVESAPPSAEPAPPVAEPRPTSVEKTPRAKAPKKKPRPMFSNPYP